MFLCIPPQDVMFDPWIGGLSLVSHLEQSTMCFLSPSKALVIKRKSFNVVVVGGNCLHALAT